MSPIYSLPVRPNSPTVTRKLSSAIYDFILHTLEQEVPDEQQLGELAHSLIAIAESHDVPIELLASWIHDREPFQKEAWTADFRRLAKAYRDTRRIRLNENL